MTSSSIGTGNEHSESEFQALFESLELINTALFLPIYCYRRGELLRCFPAHAAEFQPPPFYRIAEAVETRTPYVFTSFQATYGRLRLPAFPELMLLIGPTAQLPYTKESLRRLFCDLRIPDEDRDACAVFLQSIPCYLIQDFGNILRMINHFLGGDPALIFAVPSDLPSGTQTRKRSLVSTYRDKYLYEGNETMAYEKILVEIIERGQIDRIEELGTNFFSFEKGTLADTPLRDLKNLTIASITVFSRAAIRTGVDPQLALKMSDFYILNAEQAQTADEVGDQVTNALRAYTEEVVRMRRVLEKGSGFVSLIRYVREHTHYPLTVAHLAAQFGYNSDYLSRAFKKEMGVNLSSLIMRTKLEESKELLRYTNQSILEISEYLCFSSQNHFQTAFKKQYGLTPLAYRKLTRT